MLSRILKSLIFTLSLFASSGVAAQDIETNQESIVEQDQQGVFLSIATGSPAGTYYPVGSAICQLVNEQTSVHDIRCAVTESEGSVASLNAMAEGDVKLAMVQSDWQYHAYLGTSVFAEQGANNTLRSLFALYTEPFTVVARADADINTLDDLKGKRVNIGNPGSGQRATFQVLMDALGWTLDDFAKTLELSVQEQALAMCNGDVDAIVFVAGHPNRSVLEATTICDAVIVNVEGEAVDKLVLSQSYYAKTVIPGGMYRNNPDDIASFGVVATLVVSADVSEDSTYILVKSVLDNLDRFKTMHPGLAYLQIEKMIREGLTAPLHAGAVRYYQAAGMLGTRTAR